MDPVQTILPDKDTTFVLMLESIRRGHAVYYCQVRDLFAVDGDASVCARRLTVARADPHYQLFEERTEPMGWFDAIFMRTDPPVDDAYLHATHLLSLVDPRRTLVFNDPRGLRDANEKLYALHFPSVIPRTIISADMQRLKDFFHELGGEMIIKPLDGAGGSGIFHLRRGDRNLNALLEASTLDGKRMIVGQQYIPEVRDGDKRILLVDGEPIGAVLRVPREDETRGNIHVGGEVKKAPITPSDQRIIDVVGPRLRADGLFFVGIDVIGSYLTEVNVTSPTGIQEIDLLDGANLAAKVLDVVEHRLNARAEA